MTTYAHEWGHAMHSLLAAKAQVYDKADYPLFTAEIASTCNEQLLAAYMVGRAKTKEEKLFYLGQQLEGIRGTSSARPCSPNSNSPVTTRRKAGRACSGEAFSAIYLDLLKRYHGPRVAIDRSMHPNGSISAISIRASMSINMHSISARPISRARS